MVYFLEYSRTPIIPDWCNDNVGKNIAEPRYDNK